MVIVEYCRHGNIRQYLLNASFVNQINSVTGKIDFERRTNNLGGDSRSLDSTGESQKMHMYNSCIGCEPDFIISLN